LLKSRGTDRVPFSIFSSQRAQQAQRDRNTLAALGTAQAMIVFAPDGAIRSANDLACQLLGYEAGEMEHLTHGALLAPQDAASPESLALWSRLQAGKAETGQLKRIANGGRTVWLQATYVPVMSTSGQLESVMLLASDVTPLKLRSADANGQIAAIGRSQAIIEFTLTGEVITANQNFLDAMGYRLEEIVGRHHKLFVLPDDAASPGYKQFWERLGRGEFFAAEYRRLGKDGREVWIQASYNPIFDLDGKPFKVVKYATDVSARRTAVGLLGNGLDRLAHGDLSQRLAEAMPAEIDPLRLAFNNSLDRFETMFERLRGTSTSLKTATAEILSGANDLAHRTARQAAAIEQTSAAMRELAGTVIDNAGRAESASEKARTVAAAADEGGLVMRQANDAMDRITQSSTRISNIIGLIDDIAFQTNLLALNASVEAARAGDAGRGFAVVAVEVRRLAQSAAQASAEVKTLIEQSANEVRTGSRLVAQAADRLGTMVEGVRESSVLVDAITQASRNQSAAITEVSSAVREMDEMTQHNAALVEETNAAIEQTETQARELDKVVEIFKLSGESRGDSAPAIPPRRMEGRGEGDAPGARAAQQRYLTAGNAAIDPDWAEF
jgi:methyl-accepting chemotaxis protein